MTTATNLEMVEIYEARAATCMAHAATLDMVNPEGAAQSRDYGQHCLTMAEIHRLKHSDEVAENTPCDESFFTPCWR